MSLVGAGRAVTGRALGRAPALGAFAANIHSHSDRQHVVHRAVGQTPRVGITSHQDCPGTQPSVTTYHVEFRIRSPCERGLHQGLHD